MSGLIHIAPLGRHTACEVSDVQTGEGWLTTMSNPQRKSNTDDTVGKTGLCEMKMLGAQLPLVTSDLQGGVRVLCQGG